MHANPNYNPSPDTVPLKREYLSGFPSTFLVYAAVGFLLTGYSWLAVPETRSNIFILSLAHACQDALLFQEVNNVNET
jgi:hypothetical protein